MKNQTIDKKKSAKILERRTKIIAEEKKENKDELVEKLLIFCCDEAQKFALPYQQIDRIIPYRSFSKIPGVSPYFLGILYYNTETWPLVNLNNLLGIVADCDSRHFILCSQKNYRLALAVGDILGQIPYNIREKLSQLTASKIDEQPFIKGIYQNDTAIIEISAIFNLLIAKGDGLP